MVARQQFAGAAPLAHINSQLNAGATSFTVSETATAYPDGSVGSFVICIDRGNAAEEKILCSARSGSAFTVTTRGYDGTTDVVHSSGATVEHVVDATFLDDLSDHVYDTTRDDHTQYKLKAAKLVVVSISSNAVTLTSGTVSVVNFDTEVLDTDAFHSTSSNTSRLTVPTGLAGKYRVWGVAEFGASATGYRVMDVRKNGSTVYSLAAAPAGVSVDSIPTLNGSHIISLAEADYMEMRLFQNSGGNLTFNANTATRFGMEYLGS